VFLGAALSKATRIEGARLRIHLRTVAVVCNGTAVKFLICFILTLASLTASTTVPRSGKPRQSQSRIGTARSIRQPHVSGRVSRPSGFGSSTRCATCDEAPTVESFGRRPPGESSSEKPLARQLPEPREPVRDTSSITFRR
jgi:hypothetical protein